jgi:ketosteroid isomerase-like protein
MPQRPPIAVAISFIDCINRLDLAGLGALMAESYTFTVFDEPPEYGRARGIEGWRGYMSAFPRYVIHPREFAVDGGRVAILGTTTGSHLELPDEEEMQLTLIWLADIDDDKVAAWTLVEDTDANRRAFNLTPTR